MGRISDEDSGLHAYLTRIERFDQLDRDEELALSRAWLAHRDAAAAERLVSCNLRYVARIALGYRGYGLRLADLIAEGNLGLLEAVRRFEPDRGLRFMTYGGYWVRAFILAHVLKQSTLVGIGTGPLQSKLFFRLARERARIVGTLGRSATPDEVERLLAEKFGTTVERIREIGGRLDAKDVSLDAQIFRDGTTTHLEQLPDNRAGAEETLVHAERDGEVRRRLSTVLAGLPERERYIVDHRLLGEEGDTLADIGRHLQLSRERVRQLESRVKGKLKRAFEGLEASLSA